MKDQENNGYTIKKWFASATGPGLILPDGWFGRPHDNRHELTDVICEENFLHIVLDKGFLKLSFNGDIELNIIDGNLIINNFKSLIFSRITYDSKTKVNDKQYISGKVCFVSHNLTY